MQQLRRVYLFNQERHTYRTDGDHILRMGNPTNWAA